ncbi:MAG: putative toxin-antitoxin system toxin component, PIN family [Spartobacteria bacterium]|nr:putative toxin-antitoxin system toxin component, PIN family [Spartobacteria bacterium]
MTDYPGWVLDTNVIVSGLLSSVGPPGRLIDMVLSRRLHMVVDDRIEDEYRCVLSRPKFSLNAARLGAFLAILQFQNRVIAAPWTYPPALDPDDTFFLEAAMYASDHVLVTGNLKHFPEACRGPVRVMSPRDAWQHYLISSLRT